MNPLDQSLNFILILKLINEISRQIRTYRTVLFVNIMINYYELFKILVTLRLQGFTLFFFILIFMVKNKEIKIIIKDMFIDLFFAFYFFFSHENN